MHMPIFVTIGEYEQKIIYKKYGENKRSQCLYSKMIALANHEHNTEPTLRFATTSKKTTKKAALLSERRKKREICLELAKRRLSLRCEPTTL